MKYNFDLNQAYVKQESAINSILESKLVPKDLSEFEEFVDSKAEAYLYVDNNGKENKLSLQDVFDGKLTVCDDVPKTPEEGQLILHKLDTGKYTLEQFIDGEWVVLNLKSTAEMISINPTENIKLSNVQQAIENLDTRLETLNQNSVWSINEMSGNLELKSGNNILITTSGNIIYVHAVDVETHEEAEELKRYLEQYSDQSEEEAKAYADELDENTNIKFDQEVVRLDNKIDTLSDDVYHKDVIKNIALTGEAEDVHVNDLHEIYSNELQGVLIQLNNKIETGGSIVQLEIKKLDTPNEGYLDSYDLIFNNTKAGVSIDIPKDYVLSGCDLKECEEDDVPLSGLLPGDLYLDFTINTKDNSVDDIHLYSSLANITNELNKKANIVDLSTVAYSGSYDDLEDKLVAGSGIEIIKDSEGNNIINNLKEAIWGNIVGNLEDQIDLSTKLNELKDLIEEEAVHREQADEELKDEIKDIISPEIEALSNRLDQEILERLDSEGNIIAALNQEILDRIDGDDTLHGRIDLVEEYLETESENRIEADNELRSEIGDEAERAKGAELVLREYIDSEGNRAIIAEELISQALDDEISRSTTRDDDLDERIELVSRKLDSEGEIIFEEIYRLEDFIGDEVDRAINEENKLSDLINEEANRAKDEELKLYEYIDSEGNRAIDAERLIQEALDNEITRATEKENELAQSVKKVANRINTTVVEDLKVKEYQPDKVVLEVNKTNIYSQAKSSKQENILLANSERAGLMSPSDVLAIGDLNSRVESLEGTTHRLLYTGPVNPTEQDIDNFVKDLGYQEPYTGIAVVVEHLDEYKDSEGSIVVIKSLHIWHYYENRNEWIDDGVDTVTNFTNSYPGVIKGSLDKGKVYAESDGTGSINGWSELTTKVDDLEINSATKDELSQEQLRAESAEEQLQLNIDNLESEFEIWLDSEGNKLEEIIDLKVGQEAQVRSSEDSRIEGLITGLDTEIDGISTDLSNHLGDKSNPHEVTKAQVGLSNVVNTGDSATPSNGGTTKFTTGGAYTELAKKQDTLVSGTNIKTVANTNLLGSGNVDVITDITGFNNTGSGNENALKFKYTLNGSGGTESTIEVKHPVYTAESAAAKKIGRDSTGHVVIGDSLNASDVGITITGNSVTDGTNTFNQYEHPEGESPNLPAKLYKFSTDGTSHILYAEEVTSLDIDDLSPYEAGPGLEMVDGTTDKIIKQTYIVMSVATTDWTLDSKGYYVAEKTAAGVTPDSFPLLSLLIDPADYNKVEDLRESFSYIFAGDCTTNKITLYSSDAPTENLVIQVKGY